MTGSGLRRGWRAILAVLPQWAVARVIVLGALGAAHLVVDHSHASPARLARVHEGLLGWDAGWYEAIARSGYRALGHQSLRFFPLYPLSARVLSHLPGVSVGTALVVLANLAALVAAALLRVLVRRETGDEALAARAVWLLCLAPPAFVLVMGYAEGLLLAFTIGCFLALRRPGGPAWWLAAILAFGAGLTRPLGALLVVPVAIEALRHWGDGQVARRGGRSGGRPGSIVALLAPLAGAGTFLAWSAAAFGDGLLPLRVQTQAGHHGGLSNPFRTVAHDASGVFHHHFGTALHVVWVVAVLFLLVVCWLRLPPSYGGLATAVVLVALSGTNLDSFERYALSAFPLVVAAGTCLERTWLRRGVLVLAGAGLGVYAALAFVNVLVP